MKQILFFLLLISTQTFAQNTFKAKIVNDKTKEPLVGATVLIKALNINATTDSAGLVSIQNIPAGKFEIRFSYVSYLAAEKSYQFPLKNNSATLEIGLEPSANELSEVIIQTTRSNRSIEDNPTRVEALPLEELNEKSSMKPGDIKMLLNESTGIAVQQNSAVSGSASIRIQGLESKYTQLLKDGMPMYQGFSGGLSILQIAPLDLKQVEYVKGSASTLYGGGAIAGLVNLISKTPVKTPELSFLLNATSAKGADASGFYSQKFKKTGATVFGSYNYNGAYDPSDVGLTAIPKTNRFTLNPKFFLYPDEKTTAWIGLNTTYENRLGGDLQVIKNGSDNLHQYFERNKTYRLSTQLSASRQLNKTDKLNLKSTVGYFDRVISQPRFRFAGKQTSSFSEINYSHTANKMDWVAGVNEWTEYFKSPLQTNFNYNLATFGAFVQNTYKATNWFSLETGLRLDYNILRSSNENDFVALPRINALFKISPKFTSRIGGGLGYKMPTPFTEDTEQEGYGNLPLLNYQPANLEKSYGANGDVNFRTYFGDVLLNINQFFFYTRINKPVILQGNSLINANGNINTKGTETNFKIGVEDVSLYAGYTYTDAKRNFNNATSLQPLTSKHRVNIDFTYEAEGNYRIGLESFYSSKQLLNDGKTGRGFTTFGFLFEKMWKHINLFVNAENLTDRRQTRWDTIYTGTITNPSFRDVYTPLDGIVVNGGIKIKL